MNLPFAATVVFPTRNRREFLLRAIAAALAQTVPVEVLVMDDGSTDGSVEAVRESFPNVRYYQLAIGRGPAFQRNQGIARATAPIVFPLDDDAILISRKTIEQTLAEFDHPCVGAIGIPYVNVRVSDLVLQTAPNDGKLWVSDTYVGASHAVRRDIFLGVGGYREHFFYMGEEGDLTLRMLADGYFTRVGRADPIEHHESPNRVTSRADYYGRRNDILFVCHNVPFPYFPIHLAATLGNGLRTSVRAQYPFKMLAGLATGVGEGVFRWVKGERRPVSRTVYQIHRELKKDGPFLLTQIEPSITSARPINLHDYTA